MRLSLSSAESCRACPSLEDISGVIGLRVFVGVTSGAVLAVLAVKQKTSSSSFHLLTSACGVDGVPNFLEKRF